MANTQKTDRMAGQVPSGGVDLSSVDFQRFDRMLRDGEFGSAMAHFWSSGLELAVLHERLVAVATVHGSSRAADRDSIKSFKDFLCLLPNETLFLVAEGVGAKYSLSGLGMGYPAPIDSLVLAHITDELFSKRQLALTQIDRQHIDAFETALLRCVGQDVAWGRAKPQLIMRVAAAWGIASDKVRAVQIEGMRRAIDEGRVDMAISAARELKLSPEEARAPKLLQTLDNFYSAQPAGQKLAEFSKLMQELDIENEFMQRPRAKRAASARKASETAHLAGLGLKKSLVKALLHAQDDGERDCAKQALCTTLLNNLVGQYGHVKLPRFLRACETLELSLGDFEAAGLAERLLAKAKQALLVAFSVGDPKAGVALMEFCGNEAESMEDGAIIGAIKEGLARARRTKQAEREEILSRLLVQSGNEVD